jgi:hypothetical protein
MSFDHQHKRATVESMGLIYGHTAQVIAVLSENSRVRCDGTWSQGEGAFPDSSVLDTFREGSLDPRRADISGSRKQQTVILCR